MGDSPIAGAGTYARNGVCAVSGTGQGEVFIRRVAAYDVAARMIYSGATLAEATAAVIEAMAPHNIGAGMVAIDAAGRVVTPFNTIGMYRGWVTTEGELAVASHGEEFRLGRLER